MSEGSLRVEIQSRDAAIFRGLYESRVMTIDQIAALYFEGQREMARKRITKLKQARYLMYRAKDTAFTETIVTLDKAGYHHLLSQKLINDLPQMTWPKLEKRLDVGATVLKHELMVVDAKVAFRRGIGNGYRLAECATWPSLYAFDSVDSHGQAVSVYPDGFLRIEKTDGDGTLESCYFLEVDRSTERLEVLVERCVAYREYYRSGGFARWQGAKPDAYRDFYFRVLITCISAERRNNVAERLLMLPQPIRSQVWITTQNELMAEPFGSIWVRPNDYEATLLTRNGTGRDFEMYRRDGKRERMIEETLVKLPLLG